MILDFSNKIKEDTAILSYQVEDLTNHLNERTKKIKLLQDNLKFLNEEVLNNKLELQTVSK